MPGLMQKAALDEREETEKEIRDLEQKIQQQQQQPSDSSMDYSALFVQTSSMALISNPYMQVCPKGKLPPDLLQQLHDQFPDMDPPTTSSATTTTIPPPQPTSQNNTTPLLLLPTTPLQQSITNQTTPLLPTPTSVEIYSSLYQSM